MARQIVWNRKAVQKFDEIVEYLENNHSERTATKFVVRVYELIDKLQKYPEIGRPSQTRKTVRLYRIDKYRNLFYRKHGNKLIIVFIFDNRQHPDANPYR